MEVLEINKNLKKPKMHICKICDFITSRNQDYEMHLVTAKHKRKLLETNQNLNIPSVGFHCNECNYTTLKKNLFEKHQNSIKHIRNMNKEPTVNKHICDVCNKEYLNNSGLWKHKKICKVLENKPEVLETKKELTNEFREPENKKLEITVDLVVELLKQNKELIEFIKTNPGGMNNSNNTNCNNNNQFNLHFFLNETCKNAMNITDFVNSIQLTTQDFENTGKLGYVDGITKIIINKLNSVDTTSRPMHCTDVKRETLYIKDENVWEKEDEHKTKFKKVINQIANKNLQQLKIWKDEHPDCINLDTNDNIAFRKYYRVALGGGTNDEDEKFLDKIKRNVLKEIVVDKST
jgi:hypothetical protein